MADTLDIQTRLDIHELFARYVHLVDSNRARDWVELFTPDGAFDIPGVFRLEGREQLLAMPANVAELGGGKWRHQITNILAEPGERGDEIQVRAYGLVSDWTEGGKLISFTDYRITLKRLDDQLLIHELVANSPAPPPG